MAQTAGSKREKKSSLWLLACLVMIVFGCITGLFSLALGIGNLSFDIFLSYFRLPVLLLFNVLPSVLLHLVLYMLFGRPWLAFFLGSGAVLCAGALQGFKIWLQEDVFYLSDLLEGGSRLNFLPDLSSVSLNWVMIGALIYFVFGIVVLISLFRRRKAPWFAGRIVGAAAFACLFYPYYLQASDVEKYADLTDNSAVITEDSELLRYVSKGFLYPFVQTAEHSGEKKAPGGYSEATAARMLAAYDSSDIPKERAVDIIAVQLKGFKDLSECSFGSADFKNAYAYLDTLKNASRWGRLYSKDISLSADEAAKSFLSGVTEAGNLRSSINSYIWYLRSQGYRSWGVCARPLPAGSRSRTYGCLGLEELEFRRALGQDGREEKLSDFWLFGELIDRYKKNISAGAGPQFVFAESAQNAGPYRGAEGLYEYLEGVKDTLFYLENFTDQLEALQRPAVLVVYGSGSPDLGEEVYSALGMETELDTPQAKAQRCSTEYFIWANSAAKQLLGGPETGQGADISVNFLMSELFGSLGWDGPGYMKAQRELRQSLPVSGSGFCGLDGTITDLSQLPLETQSLLHNHEYLEYYWEDHFGLVK